MTINSRSSAVSMFLALRKEAQEMGTDLVFTKSGSLVIGKEDLNDELSIDLARYFASTGSWYFFSGKLAAPYDGCHLEHVSGFIDAFGAVHFAYDFEHTRQKRWSMWETLYDLRSLNIWTLAEAKELTDEGVTVIQNYTQNALAGEVYKCLHHIASEFTESSRTIKAIMSGIMHCTCGNDLLESYDMDEDLERFSYRDDEVCGNGGVGFVMGQPRCEDCYLSNEGDEDE